MLEPFWAKSGCVLEVLRAAVLQQCFRQGGCEAVYQGRHLTSEAPKISIPAYQRPRYE